MNSGNRFGETRFSQDEILQVNFMLNHLKTLDDKTDIIIKASNGILALVVGIVAFMIAFAPHKLGTMEILFVLVPISSILFSVISSLLLLYPKFTQYVFFEKKRSFNEIERLYHLSLRKKSSWIKLSVMGLIFGIISFIGWFIYVAI
jgi:hypothetical protein